MKGVSCLPRPSCPKAPGSSFASPNTRARSAARSLLVGLVSIATLSGPIEADAESAGGFELVARTGRMSFFSRGSLRVHPERSEKYLGHLEQLLGTKVDGRVSYYRYERPEDISAATGYWALGVTFPRSRQIHSTLAFHRHEIVHVVGFQVGTPGAFFQEGLAVAVGNRGKWNGKSVDKLAKRYVKRVSLARVLASFDRIDAQIAYPIAGSFVGRLLERHGAKKTARFFALSRGMTTASAFSSAFGVSLGEARREWADSL